MSAIPAGLVLTDTPTPTPTATAGGPTTFCDGEDVELISSLATSYQWYLNGTAIPSGTNQTYTAKHLDIGQATLYRKLKSYGLIGRDVFSAAVVVAAGSDVSVSAGGVVFALCAAVSFAIYLVTGRNIGSKSDPMVMACWVAVGAGLANLAKGAATGDLVDVSGRSVEVVLYGAATALAFTMMG